MLYTKEANSRDRKSNIEKGGGGSIVEMRNEIRVKYSKMSPIVAGSSSHCASGDSMANKSEMWVFD